MIEYKELIIYTDPAVYEPAEDTFLLVENLDIQRKDEILEIGTGTGLVAVYSAQRSKNVVATDIDEQAIKCALKNTIANKTYNIELRQGHLFEPIQNEKFDLILFNFPFNSSDNEALMDIFIEEVSDYLKKEGRVQLIHSNLEHEKTLQKLEKSGFDTIVTARGKNTAGEILLISGKLSNSK